MKAPTSELNIAIIFLISGVLLCLPIIIKQEKDKHIEEIKRDKIEALLMESLIWKTQRMRVYIHELFNTENEQ